MVGGQVELGLQYQGDQTRARIAVGDQREIPLNRPGTTAFVRVVRSDGIGGSGGVGFFQALDELIAGVKATNGSGAAAMQRGLTEVDALHLGVVLAQSDAGTDMKVVEQQTTLMEDTQLDLKKALSNVEDLDMAEAITLMQKQLLSLEAAQSTFAKVSQLSLFSYIR
jgi:flagellar hook-associated protein 3 FlgL